jgi:hypothetical protein
LAKSAIWQDLFFVFEEYMRKAKITLHFPLHLHETLLKAARPS